MCRDFFTTEACDSPTTQVGPHLALPSKTLGGTAKVDSLYLVAKFYLNQKGLHRLENTRSIVERFTSLSLVFGSNMQDSCISGFLWRENKGTYPSCPVPLSGASFRVNYHSRFYT